MKRTLRIKCPYCSKWNRIEVDKIFVEQPSKESKVQVLIPMYKPLKTEKCGKCGKVIAEPKELIRITKLQCCEIMGRIRHLVFNRRFFHKP